MITIEKIYNDESLMRNIKSFFASLAIYALLVSAFSYYMSDHSILLSKPEGTIAISLAKFAPAADSVEVAEKSLPQNKLLTQQTKPKRIVHDHIAKTTDHGVDKKMSLISPATADSTSTNSLKEAKQESQNNKSSSNEIEKTNLGCIRSMIENAITYPTIARKLKLEGVVFAYFILKPDGTVDTVKVVTTSGSDILDKKAIQTILGLSGQYPAIGKTFELSIPIAFSLKKS
jgi:TonB family protein